MNLASLAKIENYTAVAAEFVNDMNPQGDNDSINGLSRDDLLHGDSNNDTLTDSNDSDTFTFEDAFSNDTSILIETTDITILN